MANDSICLMSGEELVEMRNQPYESEDLLQELLAKHRDLLAGGQINADVPRRWLLVRLELGVPGGEGELFLGEATLVYAQLLADAAASRRRSPEPGLR